MRSPAIPATPALILFAIACAGETDPNTKPTDTGNPGTDGADGADGADGTDGTDGADGADGGGETGSPTPCDSAAGSLPAGTEVLAYDADRGRHTIEDRGWAFDYTSYGGSVWPLGESVANEGVRFELDRPARIVGFEVRWGMVPEEATDDSPIFAGIYPDFGYNGFDYWQWGPLFEGDRCAGSVRGDMDADGWTTYVLPSPLTVEPGLIYVGHQRTGAGDKAWFMDNDFLGDGSCAAWDDCHSAVNLPEAESRSYYNGLSTLIPYDYLVRLHVEYTDSVSPEEEVFSPEPDLSTSSRAAFGDYDADGWVDLFLPGPRLLHNTGGHFEDVTGASGLAGPASGGVWGDYDNDGWLDLFVFAESYTQGDSLWRNRGDGTFEDMTSLLGIDDTQAYNACGDPTNNTHAPTAGAAWWDLEGDGDLDLYLSNFICWSDYTYYVDEIYRNDGELGFVKLGTSEGFDDTPLAGRGANPADADGDGDIDLLVNNYVLHRNLYYQNNGDGSVLEAGAESGLAGIGTRTGGTTYYGHSIGTAWGDLNGDAQLDVIVANLAHPRYFHFSNKTQVMINGGDGTWTDIQGDWETPVGAAGLRYQETHSVPSLGDVDQDGNLDLAISAVYPGRPTDFYWGNGDGTFRLDAWRSGLRTENGWGMALADVDHDGDLDLATSDRLYLNQLPSDQKGHWLQVGLRGGPGANQAGIGATIVVEVGEKRILRQVGGGTGQGDQDDLVQHFGLGTSETIDAVEIRFPGQAPIRVTGPVSADQRIWIDAAGTLREGWTWAD